MTVATLDPIDLKILAELMRDGRASIVDLAARVGLSPSPCLRRVRRLEEEQVLKSYQAVVDRAKVGLGLTIWVQATAANYATETIQTLREAFNRMEEILAWYVMAGHPDYLIQVVSPDLAAYERFLMERLLTLPLRDVRSQFVIAERKATAVLPLAHLPAAGAEE